MKEESSKTRFNSSRNPSGSSPRGRGLQVAPIHRRYLPQEPETFLSDSRSSHNIFPPSSRTRKRTDTSIQTINLGGSSSIIFLVLALLCVLGFILFTQKALVGAISVRNSENSQVKRVVATATTAIEYFGEE